MTAPKNTEAHARLAALAIENGWSADEVAELFAHIVVPAEKKAGTSDPARSSGADTSASSRLKSEFDRIAPKRG